MSGPGDKLKIMERRKTVVDIARPNIEDTTIAIGKFGDRFSIPSRLGTDKSGVTQTTPKALTELAMTMIVMKFKNRV